MELGEKDQEMEMVMEIKSEERCQHICIKRARKTTANNANVFSIMRQEKCAKMQTFAGFGSWQQQQQQQQATFVASEAATALVEAACLHFISTKTSTGTSAGMATISLTLLSTMGYFSNIFGTDLLLKKNSE